MGASRNEITRRKGVVGHVRLECVTLRWPFSPGLLAIEIPALAERRGASKVVDELDWVSSDKITDLRINPEAILATYVYSFVVFSRRAIV